MYRNPQLDAAQTPKDCCVWSISIWNSAMESPGYDCLTNLRHKTPARKQVRKRTSPKLNNNLAGLHWEKGFWGNKHPQSSHWQMTDLFFISNERIKKEINQVNTLVARSRHLIQRRRAPFFHPVRSKTKVTRTARSNTFSRALRQLHTITSSFDLFTGLSLSF